MRDTLVWYPALEVSNNIKQLLLGVSHEMFPVAHSEYSYFVQGQLCAN